MTGGFFLDDVSMIVFLMVMGFLASFVDSVVGGGGLISLPAILFTGMPPVLALGTNKIAAVMGALTSFAAFVRSGKVDMSLIKILFPLSFIGSLAGVMIVRQVPPDFLRPLVVVLLISVTIYSLKRKDWGTTSTYGGLTKKMLYMSGVAAFSLGIYDGFFGPGTGSFLLFAFLFIGFDFIGAAANARALNFASNVSAALLFSYFGLVNYHYALPMGFAMICGAYCGTKMAISKGAAYIKPLFITMTTILIGKQIWDLLK
jgi:uncharacterized protein